ncbi:MAG: hypothetical protein Q9187_000781 [Circinaria calcarea]
MGLRMEDIHTPTVPSGPSTSTRYASSDGPSQNKQSLTDLMAEKDRVEAELTALSSVLDSVRTAAFAEKSFQNCVADSKIQHGVNMSTSLTTFDGFPRDDLDIAQIRTTRARIIHLRNDYKALMSRIETGLHEHYAAAKASTLPSLPDSSSPPTSALGGPSATPNPLEPPFARVNSVVAGSPADDARLMAGDFVRQFGSVTWINHEKLSKVAETVQRNEGNEHLISQPILRTLEREVNREVEKKRPMVRLKTGMPETKHPGTPIG